MKFQIKSWWSGSILIEIEAESIKFALEIACGNRMDSTGAYLTGAYLKGADLKGAYLTGADLTGAYLTGAYLTGADLTGADLTGAYLTDADLTGADLKGAYLTGADLTGADLKGADLTGAYLTGADLTGADLKGADLKGADLSPIKYDFWAVLVISVKEIKFLREALINGKVNGSQYKGECACLMGTIAHARKCNVDTLAIDSSRPAERFFLGIKTGDTPENNIFSKLAVEWLDEFVSNIGIK